MRQLSLKYRIALTILLLEAVMMGFVLWQTLSEQVRSTEQQLAASEIVALDFFSHAARLALLTEDFASLQPFMEVLRGDPRVRDIAVLDANNRVVAGSVHLIGRQDPSFVAGEVTRWRSRDLANVSGRYGRLAIEFSRAPLDEATSHAWRRGLGIAGIGMLLIAVVGVMMGYLLTRRLERVAAAAQRLAAGDFDVRVGESGTDEVAKLGSAFDDMARDLNQHLQKLSRSEERFSLAVRATNDGIWDWSVRTGSLYFSPRCARMLGYEPPLPWKTFSDWQHHIYPGDLGKVLEIWSDYESPGDRSYSVDYRLRTRNGDYIWVRSRDTATCDEDGQLVRVTGALTDITEQREQAAALEHQALHDSLTSLPNRTLFNERLRQAIRQSRRAENRLAVLMLDLDRFKEINDTLGHHTGDEVLRSVAHRLRGWLRETDTVARLGGDEFAFLLPGADRNAACHAARNLLGSLNEPVHLADHELEIGGSIGIALFPADGDDADTLIRHADVAMYMAKNNTSGFALYDAERDEHSIARLNRVAQLRRAIVGDELKLYFQPLVALPQRKIVGAEVLVRWQHPENGMTLPQDFIPVAEETGLIQPLSRWVLRSALARYCIWRKAGLRIPISVNLSARNLLEPDLAGEVSSLLRDAEVPPEDLTLEITESAIMGSMRRSEEVLMELSSEGVRVAIDDFGTGYSSLSNLKALPVNSLKIDRSFVSHMCTSENDAVIVHSTIELAHNLGITVTAEGVENKETWDLLCRLGCDFAQGYYLCRPTPGENLPSIGAGTDLLPRQSANMP
ncbi:MAG: EAL domain-containing protein [Gammaproteobacteria bacterium]|nr:EAL domain-containing protein [Gammaproteobacteria bacterium]